MKKWLVILSLYALMRLCSPACAFPLLLPEIVVRVEPKIPVRRLQSVCATLNLTVIRRLAFTDREYLVEVQGRNVGAVSRAAYALGKISWVEWAAPNMAYAPQLRGHMLPQAEDPTSSVKKVIDPNAHTVAVEPNDEYFPQQWHLSNTGQSGGTSGAHINALKAWEISTGDPNIVIAVIDSGVDTNHPDLINNLVPGYDFLEDDDGPNPGHDWAIDGHGTAIAGVIAAEGNNGIGVIGVAPKCKIMPIRIYGFRGGWIADAEIATALRWAALHGADVLSNSWGMMWKSDIIHSAVKDVTRAGGIGRDGKGCVVVWAVDFRGRPIRGTSTEAYPEVIAVGAVDHNDARWYFSDYGPELDLMASTSDFDGEGTIWTTDILGSPGFSMFNDDPNILDYTNDAGGTSMCAPMVAGVAALILSVDSNLSNEEARRYLLHSARDLGELGRDDYYGWGRVDARAALDMLCAERVDVNQDHRVDFQDFALVAQSWPQQGSLQDLVLVTDHWLNEFGLISHGILDDINDSPGMVQPESCTWTGQ